MTIRRIVATVDGSAPARRAAERALSLAGQWQAELTLVHVYEPGAAEAMSALSATSLIQENRREGERVMKSLVQDLGAVDAGTVVQLGSDVPSLLCDVARDRKADLIVMGTVGRTGVSRFFLGSVAESVVRRAHCPVWVERPTEPTMGEVERVVVCTDLSPLSEAGLILAAQVATALGSAVEVVYALESQYRGLSTEARQELTTTVRARLDDLVAKHFAGPPPRAAIVEGANVVDALTAHAARTSTDLLVLASHGRTGLSRVLLGSVAERVTRFAPCSVLVARSPVGQ